MTTDRQRAIAMYDQGMRQVDIAKALGRPAATVRNWVYGRRIDEDWVDPTRCTSCTARLDHPLVATVPGQSMCAECILRAARLRAKQGE